MALTDSWLKAQQGKEHARTFTRADRDGLGARISPLGKITFQVRYRFAGKQHRLDIGTYPTTTLKKARKDAETIRQHLEDGVDPKVAREIERQKQAGVPTVEGLYRDWHATYCAKHKTNPGLILRSFEIHAFPRVGKLPADKVDTHRWMTELEAVAAEYPAIAERLLVNAKQMYKWASRRGVVPSNPLEHMGAKTDLHLRKKVTTRVLEHWEIGLVWEAIHSSRMMPKNRLFVMLCLFYGCRNGELRLSDLEHWDLEEGTWTVPPKNHKTGKRSGKPLVRPITGPAQEWVEEARRLSMSKRKGPLFNNRDSAERMGRSSVLPLPYNIMQWARRHRGVEMAHWSMHDLRRTMRTNIADLAPPHIAEIMLGHAMPGQWGVYDHYAYLPEQRAAYDAWWERLQQIVDTDYDYAAMASS